jgi:TatD DNase family protein
MLSAKKAAWRYYMTKKNPPSLPRLKAGSYLIDSHCHLDMKAYQDDLEAVLNRAVDNQVCGVVTIGTDLASSLLAVELARKHSMLKVAIGVHPHDAKEVQDDDLSKLALLAEKHKDVIVGYGEIGLDYAKKYSEPEVQRTIFRHQLRLAKELGLPIIIHDRDAHEDCLNIIEEEGPFEQGGIMHCFSGNLDFARKIIDCNLLISIPGIVTFKNARELQEVAAQIPIDKLLLETDGPFLAPVPYRGKRNEPVYTLYIAETIAKLRETSLEDIADRTTANACRLFRYPFNDIN